MWTEEHYRREGDGYPSDLRDVEWTRLASLIPPALPRGRPRKIDMPAAMNAILYLLRIGCPRRYLPRDSFPPRSTVYNIFRKSSAWSLGGDLGRAAFGIARANGSGGQPLGGGSRQPVNQIGRKAVVTTTGGLRRRQRGKGPQDPRPGLQRGAADTSRCPLRRDSGPRRGGFGSRQDTPPLPLLDRSGLKASSTPGRSTLQWKGAAAAPGDRQAARR
jgi:hypothetical protein